MRTTVDLPPRLHARTRELARARGISMSALLAELAARGLAQLDEPVEFGVEPRTGLPVLRLGRHISSSEVADLIDDEAPAT